MRTIGPVDWAIILWSLVNRGLLAGVVGPKPMVPTMPPFFLLGRVVIPGEKKKACLTSLYGEQQTINVGMFQHEFPNLWDSHLIWSLGYP